MPKSYFLLESSDGRRVFINRKRHGHLFPMIIDLLDTLSEEDTDDSGPPVVPMTKWTFEVLQWYALGVVMPDIVLQLLELADFVHLSKTHNYYQQLHIELMKSRPFLYMSLPPHYQQDKFSFMTSHHVVVSLDRDPGSITWMPGIQSSTSGLIIKSDSKTFNIFRDTSTTTIRVSELFEP